MVTPCHFAGAEKPRTYWSWSRVGSLASLLHDASGTPLVSVMPGANPPATNPAAIQHE